jgi:hypothetical protein
MIYAKRPFVDPSHVVEYLCFVRIRHYGILSSMSKKVTLPAIRSQFGTREICFIEMRKLQSFDPKICPCCGKLSMVTVETIPARGPPRPTADKLSDIAQITNT